MTIMESDPTLPRCGSDLIQVENLAEQPKPLPRIQQLTDSKRGEVGNDDHD
jgi:hypothetical protein